MTTARERSAQASSLRVLQRVIRPLDMTSYGVIVLVMGAMTLLVSLQVFYRYTLASSIDSANELSRLFFVWAIFLAIPHGVKYGVHVGIDLVVRALSLRLQDVIFRLTAAAGAILMVVVFVASWEATLDKWQELMPTLPMTAAVYYIPVLIGTGHTCLHLVVLAWGGAGAWVGENDL